MARKPRSRARPRRALAPRWARLPRTLRFAGLPRGLRLVGTLIVLAISAVLALQLWYFAHVLWWSRFDPDSTRFMRGELQRLQHDDPARRLRHRWVDYERISVHLKRAVIAAEDANFTDHDGVDWDAIERAYERNRRRGRVVLGGSTITMQLAKNLFLSGERSYLRKGQELVIAYMIETVMTKRRILELYLNVAEWGVGVFGAEAGARHHFGVSAAQLGASQAARMAAMLPRPRYYDAHRDSPALARRAAIVGRWMGAIDPP